MWFCKNSGQQSIKSSYLHIGVLNCLQLSIVDINWMAGSVFGGISYNVSTIFAKSHEKSHRLWTKNLSLARGLLALQIKIPLGIHFLGPWEGGKQFYFFFLVTLTSPPGHPSAHWGSPFINLQGRKEGRSCFQLHCWSQTDMKSLKCSV